MKSDLPNSAPPAKYIEISSSNYIYTHRKITFLTEKQIEFSRTAYYIHSAFI